MEKVTESCSGLRRFAVICVLGAPGAGKGTICSHLARQHDLIHYSVGDSLRDLVKNDPATPLAAEIQDKLDNQGFLPPYLLNPLIGQAINDALGEDGSGAKGIMIDGFPRCVEQLASFDARPFKHESPSRLDKDDESKNPAKPDVVLLFKVSKENAKDRYTKRRRDDNDSVEKFERRFSEYQAETVPVIDVYRQSGILIDIDANGTKEETVNQVARRLALSGLWQDVVTHGRTKPYFVAQGS